ncbi:hypothetical protein A1p_00033 [Klebsiella phage VLCpiA1p]|nr:hypothetical protein A1p_00033 [Klebsiella phage VLCpiA1p]UVX29079.1 hypothetical protein A1r_00033 [Klebsiella phage VLCpiA1r]UVX29146.1 hypothetical protein A1q_00043 [Klebsiella phage VLCpiA1q]
MKMGICSVLGLIFVTLKLTGVIAWSWLWVLLPFWGPIAVFVLFVVLVVPVCTLLGIAKAKRELNE